MKTVILCVVFLIIGSVAGAALAWYFLDTLHKRTFAVIAASDLGLMAIQADLIKRGETAYVLNTLEKSIPDKILTIHGDEMMRDAPVVETSMKAAKRFYVCTQTPIPESISKILEPVTLSANACEAPK